MENKELIAKVKAKRLALLEAVKPELNHIVSECMALVNAAAEQGKTSANTKNTSVKIAFLKPEHCERMIYVKEELEARGVVAHFEPSVFEPGGTLYLYIEGVV